MSSRMSASKKVIACYVLLAIWLSCGNSSSACSDKRVVSVQCTIFSCFPGSTWVIVFCFAKAHNSLSCVCVCIVGKSTLTGNDQNKMVSCQTKKSTYVRFSTSGAHLCQLLCLNAFWKPGSPPSSTRMHSCPSPRAWNKISKECTLVSPAASWRLPPACKHKQCD
jgi:hypothetical protein